MHSKLSQPTSIASPSWLASMPTLARRVKGVLHFLFSGRMGITGLSDDFVVISTLMLLLVAGGECDASHDWNEVVVTFVHACFRSSCEPMNKCFLA